MVDKNSFGEGYFDGICSSWKLSPLLSTFCLDASAGSVQVQSWVKKSPPAAGRKASNFYGFGVVVLFPLLILSEPFSAPSEFLFLSVILRIPPKQRKSVRLENLKIQCRCCSFMFQDLVIRRANLDMIRRAHYEGSMSGKWFDGFSLRN